MNNFLIILFALLSINAKADIVISKDTTINDQWIIPATTILRFETGGHISGNGTVNGGIIQAAYTQDLFDTTINLVNAGLYSREFSVQWYGAKPINTDNYNNIQKSINTCLNNNIKNVYVPAGVYNYSKSLFISAIYLGIYTACTIHLHGETSFWDVNVGALSGSVLNYTATTNTFALGMQLNKGSEIDHLTISGLWAAPIGRDTVFFNTSYENFNDRNGVYGDGYTGIEIDPYPNQDGSYSGSTGVHVHDMIIKSFTTLISVSKNEFTLNGEILIFENLQFGDAKTGFVSREAQEKGNVIRGIYSWGSIHTLFVSGMSVRQQGAHYTIDGGNIAGRCIRLFYINSDGWESVNISNLFVESIATIGMISNSTSCQISNCIFDFVLPNIIGQRVLLNTTGDGILFNSCLFRYFATSYPLRFQGQASFMNCFWSGPYVNPDPGGRHQLTLPSGIRLKL